MRSHLHGGLLNTNLTTAISPLYNARIRERMFLSGLAALHDRAGKGQNGNLLYIFGERSHRQLYAVFKVFEHNIRPHCWFKDFASIPISCIRCVSTTTSLMFSAGRKGNPDTYTNVWPQNQACCALSNMWTSYKDIATPALATAAMAYNDHISIPTGELEAGDDAIFFQEQSLVKSR